jgi:hypothetical protein
MRRPGVRSSAPLAALLAAAACSGIAERVVEPAACVPPVVVRVAVATDSTNVLRAFVSAEVRGADSVVVRYGPGDVRDRATPALVPVGDSLVTPILGLDAQRAHSAQVEVYGSCARTSSDALTFTTGALPADLPSYAAEGSAPAPGYIVFAAGSYGLVVDNSGRVVWYHRFTNGPGLNFQAQPDGRYAARLPAPVTVPGVWTQIDPAGRVARTVGCARGFQPRMHDMITRPDGSYWLLCDEVRTIDLSAQGGARDARVMGTGVQHRSATGDVLFEWSPFDHLEVVIGILDPADRDAAVVNWTHGNALDLDADGNLLVSFRNLSEVTKIDTRTGAVLWRLGGIRNQFTIEGDAPPFIRQHGARALGGGQLLLLDNLGHPDGSRAERYELDEVRRVARLRETRRSAAALVAQVGGTAQGLPGGHTLVSFGSGNGVEEYDAAGNVVWRLTGKTGYVFRAQRIRSLYQPGVGDPR